MFDLSSKNCEYRGEGNTCLVIKLKKEGKILCLIKEETSVYKNSSPDDLHLQLNNQISVIQNVYQPLLGKIFISVPECVFLKQDDIKKINDWCESQRPSFRNHKCLKENDTYALLMSDLCSLPSELSELTSSQSTISIEIKPKQGFLAKEAFLPFLPYVTCPARLCRHCMVQHLKIKKGSTTKKSPYCPTDLFSGCIKRMKHALQTLIETPQNNLRIFLDQKIAYSEENKENLIGLLNEFFVTSSRQFSHLDLLCNLLIKVLLKPFQIEEFLTTMYKAPADCENGHKCCCNSFGLCHELPEGCILKQILSVQQLHKLHIKDLYSLSEEILQLKRNLSESIGCLQRNEIPKHVGTEEKQEEETHCHYMSRKVWEFLVSSFAKDCFIMIVLKKYTERDNFVKNTILDDDGNMYIFSIAVGDLDSKPLSRVEHHYKQTPQLLQACLAS